MLIVRHLKSLSVSLLSHLEKTAAWLMVSIFQSLARRVTGASRAYGRFRGANDAGENSGALRFYDRNVPQSRSVGAMLSIMRQRGFLDVQHRGSEWIKNVFCHPPRRMAKIEYQDLLLHIDECGKKTTALHYFGLFPEGFGRMTKRDRIEYFSGKKFKKWTSYKRIATAGQSMLKDGGSFLITCGEDEVTGCPRLSQKRPKDNAAASNLCRIGEDKYQRQGMPCTSQSARLTRTVTLWVALMRFRDGMKCTLRDTSYLLRQMHSLNPLVLFAMRRSLEC